MPHWIYLTLYFFLLSSKSALAMYTLERNEKPVGYIMGTIHNVPLEESPFYNPYVKEIIQKSTALLKESASDITIAETIQAYKEIIKSHPEKRRHYYQDVCTCFSLEERDQIDKILKNFQVSEGSVELWELLFYVFSSSAHDTSYEKGMDFTLQEQFETLKKPVISLESGLSRLEDCDIGN